MISSGKNAYLQRRERVGNKYSRKRVFKYTFSARNRQVWVGMQNFRMEGV